MPRSDFTRRRRILDALEVVALRRSIPKRPDKLLSYLPIVLSVVILRILPFMAFAYWASQARGLAQVGLVLVDLLMLALAALHAFGFVLAVKYRQELVQHTRSAGADPS